jgi:hypothetical protein
MYRYRNELKCRERGWSIRLASTDDIEFDSELDPCVQNVSCLCTVHNNKHSTNRKQVRVHISHGSKDGEQLASRRGGTRPCLIRERKIFGCHIGCFMGC